MMNPYLSWAILLVVAGGLGWYYNAPAAKTPLKPAVIESPESAVSAKKPKRKTARKEKSPEPAPTKADEKKQQPAVEKSASPQNADQDDEEIDNKEMAERFAAVKSGAIPAGGSKSQKKKKNKKATSAGQLESPSTTGAEADDDLSSTGSPVVNPTVPAAGYVSDMLEEPAPGASVLRVTGSVESQPKKQKPQSFKQVETKKQRQQRMKNEARKEQVQAAEDERRKLLEKQLHTARESERREAAKAKPAASTTNAWQQPAQNAASAPNGASKAAPAATSKVELLDTFDHDSSSAKPATNGNSNKWSQALPSEEEQMRMLNASNPADEWTTVSTKTKKQPKKKGGKVDESQSEASASESNQPAAVPAPAEPKVTVTPTYLPDILRSKQKGHPLDSDWAA